MQRVEQHDKDALPADAIWGATADPALRLITCAGSRDNIIVHASAQ